LPATPKAVFSANCCHNSPAASRRFVVNAGIGFIVLAAGTS